MRPIGRRAPRSSSTEGDGLRSRAGPVAQWIEQQFSKSSVNSVDGSSWWLALSLPASRRGEQPADAGGLAARIFGCQGFRCWPPRLSKALLRCRRGVADAIRPRGQHGRALGRASRRTSFTGRLELAAGSVRTSLVVANCGAVPSMRAGSRHPRLQQKLTPCRLRHHLQGIDNPRQLTPRRESSAQGRRTGVPRRGVPDASRSVTASFEVRSCRLLAEARQELRVLSNGLTRSRDQRAENRTGQE